MKKNVLLSALFTISLLCCPPAHSQGGWTAIGSLDRWNSKILDSLSETFLILGEVHGTEEAPRSALGLARSLRERGREVVLAIEWPQSLQSRVDQGEWEGLKDEPFFQAGDGRTSRAMVNTLRDAKADGIPVRLFDQVARSSHDREMKMAIALHGIAKEHPAAAVVVLVGNYHSRLGAPESSPSMATLLSGKGVSLRAISLVAGQGDAWNIIKEGRGRHSVGEPVADAPDVPSFRVLSLAVRGHNAELYLPRGTASPPWSDHLSNLDVSGSGTPVKDNAELARMFADDQAFRISQERIDWAQRRLEDSARRVRVRELLESGDISTGQDFWHAALIYQHGETPDDYLLAHTFACAALARGKADAAWIAAASLDRYLGSVGQPQIYGTQFKLEDGKNYTQGLFNTTLIPDSLRQILGVPQLSEQDEQRKLFQKKLDAEQSP
jgi:hypothetical protein